MTSNNDRLEHRLRSRDWFDDPERIDQTALYLERFMNYGITPDELRSGKPIIGIAQTGSDLVPCNRHHLPLAQRVRDGIRDAGGVPMEFPVHPLFENCLRPTAALERNLAYLGLVEILYGYPIDAVVLTTGCDKTTPSSIMAASTVDIPAIVLSGGPMLDGYFEGELVGSGMAIWKSRRRLAAGLIDEEQFFDTALASAPSAGHCNTMGTASTMNSVAEVLGLSLPGCAMIPAPYGARGQMAYDTGRRIVEMAYEDLRPSKILTREAFLNAIVAVTAIGGSTNAQPHLMAMARHAGVDLEPADWAHGYEVPLLVNMQPAGAYLGERFHRAGGVPAVLGELLRAGRLDGGTLTVMGRTLAENVEGCESTDREMIAPYDAPLQERAGSLVLTGNLFEFAIIKTSVISEEFRARYLREPGREGIFEGRAVVFDGSDDYHHRINGFGRGRQYAAARRAHQAGDQHPAHHRRRPAVRHLGQPLDPPRRARERRWRWSGVAADRRYDTHRPQHRALRHARIRGGDRAPQKGGGDTGGPGEPHALAGDLPGLGGPARRRRGHGAGTEVPEPRLRNTATQPLRGESRPRCLPTHG
jgi:xylonate dehydratase